MPAVALAGAVLFTGCLGRIGEPGASVPGPLNPNNPNNPNNPSGPVDVGRVTIHRLNRAEYNNTVRTLLGTSRRPADEFPADDRGYGFDNIADVLSLSPVQIEMYQAAAETLVNEALGASTGGTTPLNTQINGAMMRGENGAARGTSWLLTSGGDLTATVTLPAAGRYRVTVRAWQQQAGPDAAQMTVMLGTQMVGTFNVPNLEASPGEFNGVVTVSPGGATPVTVTFNNDYYMMPADRNLGVSWVRVEGPLDAAPMMTPAPTGGRARIMVCDPATMGAQPCAREIITRFGRRAWRRPLTADEVTELLAFQNVAMMHGGSFEDGIKLSLQAMLVSPQFLFRVELDPDPASPTPHALNDHELASRLSYFLWSDMPDEMLFAAADAGRLSDPNELRSQVTRMLADPRSQALVDNFAGQWLYTRLLDSHEVRPDLFPRYDEALRTAYGNETLRFFREFLTGDYPVQQMLTADFTYVNARLAMQYGVTVPAGTPADQLVRVSLAGTPRRGLITQGSLLTVTSHAERTSPVKRGQWVLTQLLCAPPPPPPPAVEGLPDPGPVPTGTLRQRFEAHRSDPSCSACHRLMDPIGFGLENFDAVGAHRTQDVGGFAIDSTGELPDGTRFEGAVALGEVLARDNRFPRCVAQQMFTYALGRGPQDYDVQNIDRIASEWVTRGGQLRELVAQIVTSPAFRQRRGEPVRQGGN